jgi:hypothetical protein
MARFCVRVFVWSYVANSWQCVRTFRGRHAVPSARQFMEDHGGDGWRYYMVRWRLPTYFWERIAWGLRRELMRLDRREARIRVQRRDVRRALAEVSMARQLRPLGPFH